MLDMLRPYQFPAETAHSLLLMFLSGRLCGLCKSKIFHGLGSVPPMYEIPSRPATLFRHGLYRNFPKSGRPVHSEGEPTEEAAFQAHLVRHQLNLGILVHREHSRIRSP